MPTAVWGGPKVWTGKMDRNGAREYKITYMVLASSPTLGPATAMACPDLPQPGDFYIVDDDSDTWATFKLDREAKQVTQAEPGVWWEVTLTAATEADSERCKDQQIDDPLLVPPEISGGFTKFQEEASIDRFGNPITNSAHELFHGPQNEWDGGKPNVKIKMNVPTLQLDLLTSMQDAVNDATLWGLPPRCIKLSNISWEKRYYGQCYPYYEVSYDFDVDFKTFDRDILDEATKVLHGHWSNTGSGAWVLDTVAETTFVPPNPANPQHFDQFVDRQGNPAKAVLNGAGLPAGVQVGTGTSTSGGPAYAHVEKYQSMNFLLLGIPTSF